MMRRALPLLCLLLPLSACLGYPRPYLTTVKGHASLDDGKPIKIQAAIIKTCDTVQGETEHIGPLKETLTDKDGRYSLTLMGVVWRYKNFVTLSECDSHIQRFVCRPYCKKVDEIDIDILGK